MSWLIFLAYLAAYPVAEGREGEVLILAHLGALYLGFPYGYFGALLASAIGMSPSTPMAAALLQFSCWAIGSLLLLGVFVWRRLQKPGPASRRKNLGQ